jgi:competence protein ComEC
MILSKSKIFFICCLAFISGITIASFASAYLINYNFYFFTAVILAFAISFIFWQNKKIRLISLIGVFLFLGMWRYVFALPPDSPDKIWHYNGKEESLTGLVADEPDERTDNQKLKIKVVYNNTEQKIIAGRILVTTNLYPVYHYGDRLEMSCRLEAPKFFNDFAYDRFLARYDIYSVCYYPKIKITAREQGGFFYANLFKIKNKLRSIINYSLTATEAGLAKAIIFGDKRDLLDDLLEKFSQEGTTHIMAISGMNITILAALTMNLFLFAGLYRRTAFYFSTFFLIIYIALVGAPASAVRAGIMGFLLLWAINSGRLNRLTNTTVLAGAIMLLINPKLLRDDIGFHLSFLAILGIIYLYPRFEEYFDRIKIPKLKGLRGVLSVTVAAQVFTLPLLAYNFSIVSLIAPLANLLILWTLSPLTVLLIGAIFLSLIIPSFSVLFFFPAWLLLFYVIEITELIAKIPFIYYETGYIRPAWLVIWLLILGLIIYKNRNALIAKHIY